MKLFDLSPAEKKSVRRFLAWHLGYIAYVTVFAFVIYRFNLFKAYWFLKESSILNLVSPLHTLAFIIISPYRRDWWTALKNTYRALDGEPIFCAMALLVVLVGFYLYNAVLWGVGSLLPSIFFT
jgi:hypothetical protein